MEINKYEVFISYRRCGGDKYAELIKLALINKGIDESRIFLDTHAMQNTEDFEQYLVDAVKRSNNVVVIISKNCFAERRLNDRMVKEVEIAISERINIIPIFFDDVVNFENQNLPDSIKSLETTNAISYNHEYTDAFYNKLLSFLVPNTTATTTHLFQTNVNSFRNKKMIYGIIASVIVCLVGFFIFTKSCTGTKTDKQVQIYNSVEEDKYGDAYITKTGHKYHPLNCGHVRNKDNAKRVSCETAERYGYQPCNKWK